MGFGFSMEREHKSSLVSEQNHYKTVALPKLLLKTFTSKTAKKRKEETNSRIWSFTLIVTKGSKQTNKQERPNIWGFTFPLSF